MLPQRSLHVCLATNAALKMVVSANSSGQKPCQKIWKYALKGHPKVLDRKYCQLNPVMGVPASVLDNHALMEGSSLMFTLEAR